MIKVRIPTPLRPLTKGQGEVESTAATITDMIGSLDAAYPGLKNRLCDETGELRRFVNIYVNEEDIRFLKGKETSLKDGDEVLTIRGRSSGRCGGQQPRHAIPRTFRHAPDRRAPPRPLPRRAEELGASAGRVRLLLLRRRLACADDALRITRGHRRQRL